MSKTDLSRRGLFGLFAGAAAVVVAPKIEAVAALLPEAVGEPISLCVPRAVTFTGQGAWAVSRVFDVGDTIFIGVGEGGSILEGVITDTSVSFAALDYVRAA